MDTGPGHLVRPLQVNESGKVENDLRSYAGHQVFHAGRIQEVSRAQLRSPFAWETSRWETSRWETVASRSLEAMDSGTQREKSGRQMGSDESCSPRDQNPDSR